MNRITTLTGPSCAGKSTLENMMQSRGCLKAVSTTTRQPREGEVDGVDYYFVSREKFATMESLGMFVECVQFGDNSYGLSVAEVNHLFEKADSHIVVVCEPNGARQIQDYCATRSDVELVSVFVDGEQSVINDRFLKRSFDDMMAALKKGEGFHKVSKTYAKRLEIMMTEENEWRKHVYNYTVCFDTFDETNADKIADELCGDAYVFTELAA